MVRPQLLGITLYRQLPNASFRITEPRVLAWVEHLDVQVDGKFDAPGRSGEAFRRLDNILPKPDPV